MQTKQRLKCRCTKQKRELFFCPLLYMTRVGHYWQNTTFTKNQQAFHHKVCSSTPECIGSLDGQEVLSFWRAIFEKSANANLDCSWLSHLQQNLNNDVNPDHSTPQITCKIFSETLHTLRNWASPDPDGIQRFWWKCFSSVHVFLREVFNQFLLGDMELPVWFPVRRTLLIPKATNPKNYRPITCLNIIYKMWTRCLTTLMLNHCDGHQILHLAQKGCSRDQQGCVDHLHDV